MLEAPTRAIQGSQRCSVQIHIQVGSGADPERRDRATNSLHEDLLEMGVGQLQRATDPVSVEGMRALDVVALGALAISIKPSVALLAQLVQTIRNWIGRSSNVVKLQIDGDQIELTGVTTEERSVLIATWIERHGTTSDFRDDASLG